MLKNNDYKAALSFVKNSSMEKPIKLFNEAYIHYKDNQLSLSRYKLEKAKYHGLYSENYNSAIKEVRNSLGIDHIETGYPVKDKAVLELSGFQSDVYFSVIGIFLFLFLIGIAKAQKALGIFSSVMVITLGVLSFYLLNLTPKISMQERIVYEGPSKMFEQVQILPEGIKFITAKKDNDWHYIEYPQYLRGWVYNLEAKSL